MSNYQSISSVQLLILRLGWYFTQRKEVLLLLRQPTSTSIIDTTCVYGSDSQTFRENNSLSKSLWGRCENSNVIPRIASLRGVLSLGCTDVGLLEAPGGTGSTTQSSGSALELLLSPYLLDHEPEQHVERSKDA